MDVKPLEATPDSQFEISCKKFQKHGGRENFQGQNNTNIILQARKAMHSNSASKNV
jgi:hypothetical protein